MINLSYAEETLKGGMCCRTVSIIVSLAPNLTYIDYVDPSGVAETRAWMVTSYAESRKGHQIFIVPDAVWQNEQDTKSSLSLQYYC